MLLDFVLAVPVCFNHIFDVCMFFKDVYPVLLKLAVLIKSLNCAGLAGLELVVD